MISVVTITYQRHHILEEAIESFLRQDYKGPSEMIIVNDSPDVEYVFDHPNVRIFNLKERFPSITTKLKWACEQTKYDYIYRLDDDDLLAPWALSFVDEDIKNHPNHDIYRSDRQYYFVNNKFNKITSNVNNGNVFCKQYLDRIHWPSSSSGEDANLVFGHKGKICTSSRKPTMIYRWGMNTYHISGMGILPNAEMQKRTDQHIKQKETGTIILSPHFKEDYYKQLP